MGGPDILCLLLGLDFKENPNALLVGFGVGTVGALGSVIGSLLLYRIGEKAGAWALKKFRIAEATFSRLHVLINKRQLFSVFIGALAPPPVPKKPIVIICGISRIPLPKFCLGMFSGRLARYFLFCTVGRMHGEKALDFVKNNTQFVATVFIMCSSVFAIMWLLVNLMCKAKQSHAETLEKRIVAIKDKSAYHSLSISLDSPEILRENPPEFPKVRSKSISKFTD